MYSFGAAGSGLGLVLILIQLFGGLEDFGMMLPLGMLGMSGLVAAGGLYTQDKSEPQAA